MPVAGPTGPCVSKPAVAAVTVHSIAGPRSNCNLLADFEPRRPVTTSTLIVQNHCQTGSATSSSDFPVNVTSANGPGVATNRVKSNASTPIDPSGLAVRLFGPGPVNSTSTNITDL